jgi:hypothetical protein
MEQSNGENLHTIRTLESFKDIHKGETIWVLGSGGSLDFLDPSFFDDKICVGVNFVGKTFGLTNYFTFSHYHLDSLEMAESSRFVFAPKKEHGARQEWSGPIPANVILFETTTGEPGYSFDPFGKDNPTVGLMIGNSSIHGSIHLAAYLGAKHIVLVGADCGKLNGVDRFNNYVPGDNPWSEYNTKLIEVKRWILENFGAKVYSLNPFVNFNLEGVSFDGEVKINL